MGKRIKRFEQRESFVVTFDGWEANDLRIEADRRRMPIADLIRKIVSKALIKEVVLPDDSPEFDGPWNHEIR
jgi:hypothetical protein